MEQANRTYVINSNLVLSSHGATSSPYCWIAREEGSRSAAPRTIELEMYIEDATRLFNERVHRSIGNDDKFNKEVEEQLRFITESIIQACRALDDIKKVDS